MDLATVYAHNPYIFLFHFANHTPQNYQIAATKVIMLAHSPDPFDASTLPPIITDPHVSTFDDIYAGIDESDTSSEEVEHALQGSSQDAGTKRK